MVEEVSPEVVVGRLRARESRPLLLDVREAWERELAVIEPSLHIPMQELPGRLRELPRDRPIVVYCHTGVRSEMVAGFLEAEGFGPVSNLSGGIDTWSVQVDPKVPRYA